MGSRRTLAPESVQFASSVTRVSIGRQFPRPSRYSRRIWLGEMLLDEGLTGWL